MNHVAYVEWYTDYDESEGLEFEEFDHHLKVYSGRMFADGYCGLLDLELDNDGIPEDWIDELKKHPSGFYKLEYDSYTDSEYCEGHIAYSYEVPCEIISMRKSMKARVYYWLDRRVYPVIDCAISMFLPRWSVAFTYGGAGVTREKMYFIKAVWVRFVNPKKYAGMMWGENYTNIEMHRR